MRIIHQVSLDLEQACIELDQAYLHYFKINQSESKIKFYLVAYPLSLFGEHIFQDIFSFVLGFDWFLKKSNPFDLPDKKIELPTIRYLFGMESDLFLRGEFVTGRLSNLYGFYDPYISTFALGSNVYRVNSVNFWAVGLNYFFRNLGKLLGYLFASPWSIPAYVLTKSAFGVVKMGHWVKRIVLEYRLNYLVSQEKSESLAKSFIMNTHPADSCRAKPVVDLYLKIIAEYLEPQEFIKSAWDILNEHNIIDGNIAYITKQDIEDNISRVATHFAAYKKARKEFMQEEWRSALIKISVTGIFIIPLFYTIPAYFKMKQRHSDETQLLNKYTSILESVTHRSTSDAYIRGKTLLDSGILNLAFIYLSSVPESSRQYIMAMQECAHMLLANKQPEAAALYFNKAGDQRSVEIADDIFKNPNMQLGQLVPSHKPVETPQKRGSGSSKVGKEEYVQGGIIQSSMNLILLKPPSENSPLLANVEPVESSAQMN